MRNCRLLLAAITLVASSAMADNSASTPMKDTEKNKAPSVSEKVLKNGLKVLRKIMHSPHKTSLLIMKYWLLSILKQLSS